MNLIRQAASLLLVSSFFSGTALGLLPSAPALAQATVLTGQVATIGTQPLLERPASYDRPPSYGGTTYVQPKMQGNAAAAQKVPSHANLTSSTNQNFHPQRPLIHTVYVRDNRTFFQRHPMVKSASVGAGVGAGAGALTGLVTGRGVVRGALIGGGAGAGVGVVRSSQIMKRHPIVRDVATGSLVGLGLGAAASRGHRLPLQATGVGAAIGLGAGLFKNLR